MACLEQPLQAELSTDWKFLVAWQITSILRGRNRQYRLGISSNNVVWNCLSTWANYRQTHSSQTSSQCTQLQNACFRSCEIECRACYTKPAVPNTRSLYTWSGARKWSRRRAFLNNQVKARPSRHNAHSLMYSVVLQISTQSWLLNCKVGLVFQFMIWGCQM